MSVGHIANSPEPHLIHIYFLIIAVITFWMTPDGGWIPTRKIARRAPPQKRWSNRISAHCASIKRIVLETIRCTKNIICILPFKYSLLGLSLRKHFIVIMGLAVSIFHFSIWLILNKTEFGSEIFEVFCFCSLIQRNWNKNANKNCLHTNVE